MTGAPTIVDADSHVLEPPDVWLRHAEPRFRERAVRVVRADTGRDVLVDGKPAKLTTPEMLGDFGGRTSVRTAPCGRATTRTATAPPATLDDLRELAATLPDEPARRGLLGENAARLYGIATP